jgi:hypothetical protein
MARLQIHMVRLQITHGKATKSTEHNLSDFKINPVVNKIQNRGNNTLKG